MTERSSVSRVYSRVSGMEGKEGEVVVSPDIDLLKVDTITRETTGYETKLLKFRRSGLRRWRRRRFDYRLIYQGLGESLAYFNYGIERVYLVVAFESAPEVVSPFWNWEKLIEKLRRIVDILWSTPLNNYLGLRMIPLVKGYPAAVSATFEMSRQYHSPRRVRGFNWIKQPLIDDRSIDRLDKKLYGMIYSLPCLPRTSIDPSSL